MLKSTAQPLASPTRRRGRPVKYPVDLSGFRCPFCDSTDIRTHGRYGKVEKRACLRCVSCGKTFSERRGSSLFHAKLPSKDLTRIMWLLIEGKSARQISKETGRSTDAIAHVARGMGIPKRRWVPPIDLKNYEPIDLAIQCPNGHKGFSDMIICDWRFRKRTKDWVLKLRCKDCRRFFMVPLVEKKGDTE